MRHRDCLLAGLVTALVFLRLALAEGESFSYDYANYLTYFRALQDAEWAALQELLPLTFPYVFVPGGGAFELGFVALAMPLLQVFPAWATYALFGALSVGLRTWCLRALGLGWAWLLPVQAYAITLLEANALRAGMALTLTLWSLVMFRRRARWRGLLGFVAAASLHMQVLLFVGPYLLSYLVPLRWARRPEVALGFLVSCLVATRIGIGLIGGLDFAKLDDYTAQDSGAVGLNLITGLSTLWMLAALLFALRVPQEGGPSVPGSAPIDDVWVRAVYAAMPALALVLLGTELSAVGDRAWQFAMVIMASLSGAMMHRSPARWARGVLLGLLLSVALINTLWRYPLSNFFSPPLPYTRIVPLWLVR